MKVKYLKKNCIFKTSLNQYTLETFKYFLHLTWPIFMANIWICDHNWAVANSLAITLSWTLLKIFPILNHPCSIPGGQASYTPSYEGGYQPNYDDEEAPHHPKITTTTKSFTTNSAANTGGNSPHYRREAGAGGADSLGDISFKLGDYLKNTPGHESGGRFTQKAYDGKEYSIFQPSVEGNMSLGVMLLVDPCQKSVVNT